MALAENEPFFTTCLTYYKGGTNDVGANELSKASLSSNARNYVRGMVAREYQV